MSLRIDRWVMRNCFQVCELNVMIPVFISIAVCLPSISRLLSALLCIYLSLFALARMLYQVNCCFFFVVYGTNMQVWTLSESSLRKAVSGTMSFRNMYKQRQFYLLLNNPTFSCAFKKFHYTFFSNARQKSWFKNAFFEIVSFLFVHSVLKYFLHKLKCMIFIFLLLLLYNPIDWQWQKITFVRNCMRTRST